MHNVSLSFREQVVCAVYSVAATYSNLAFLPFYKPVMNIANILHSGAFASATVFLVCAHVRGVPEVRLSMCGWTSSARRI